MTTIRELVHADLADLLRLYQHLHAHDDSLPPMAEVKSLWEEMQANPLLKYFGVFVEEQLVASCTLTIIPNLTHACRPYGLIENVVTHANFRRQGHGKAVLQHALDFAWQANCYKVMLLTGRKDEGTLAFYEAAGFDRHAKQAFIARP